jgi:predicted DCC family thiol-disulfide oxidoreductase YuxK
VTGDNSTPSRPVLVFDGDCGFCTTWAGRAERWWRLDHVEPYQFIDLEPLGLTAERCAEAVQWVGADGTVSSGERVIVAGLRHRGGVWGVLGRLIALPGMVQLAGIAYRIIARNRFKLPGATPACQIGRH